MPYKPSGFYSMARFAPYLRTGYNAARTAARLYQRFSRARAQSRGRSRPQGGEKKHDEPVHKVTSITGFRKGPGVSGQNYNTSSIIKRNPKMVKYMGTLKDILSDPRTDMVNIAVSVNNEVNNFQGQCGWYGWRAFSLGDMDNMLSQGYNANLVTGTAPVGGGAITASLVDGGIPIASVPSDYEVFFERATMETIMKNSSSQQVRLTLWECYPRKDLPIGVSNPYGLDPQLLQDGFSDTVPDNQAGGSGAGQNAILYNSYGATPFMSGDFAGCFKIKQLHNCVIEPGEQLTHQLKHNGSFLLSKRSFGVKSASSIGATYTYTRKQGTLMLLRVEGMPVHNESAVTHTGRNDNTQVSTGTYALDIVQTKRFSYRVPFKTEQRRTGYTSTSLGTYTLINEQAFQEYAPEVQKTG